MENLIEIQDRIETLKLRLKDHARLVNMLVLGFQALEMDDGEYSVPCFRTIERAFLEAGAEVDNIFNMLEVLKRDR